MYTSESPALQVLYDRIDKGLQEGQIDIIGIEIQGQPRIGPDWKYITVHIRPSAVVLVDASQHKDTFLCVVPFAEEIEATQGGLVE